MAQATQILRVQQRHHLKSSLIYHIAVAFVGIVMLYPIVWMFSSSFKDASEIWNQVNSLIPNSLHLENYERGWNGFGGITFATYYKNSTIYTVLGVLFHVSTSAIIAYGFARIKFVGRNIWFAIMLLTLMLPSQVLFIPQYIIFAKLDWINTFYPLLIPRLGGEVFFIFMIVQFIRGIPIDLDEAAMIDGCSRVGVFFRIILPQLKPAIITAAIFSFYWTWEDFLGPLIYLTKPNKYTVSVALRAFADPSGMTDWGAIFAMMSLSLIPVFVVFVVFQRYLVEGISTTGLKG
ncbi:MAG TPA: carbohydrate ABC transporter permease [Aggregatilineales bacterium]|nr:carbohydrate ABC transporter permease [Aggregatilineales bacterium]